MGGSVRLESQSRPSESLGEAGVGTSNGSSGEYSTCKVWPGVEVGRCSVFCFPLVGSKGIKQSVCVSLALKRHKCRTNPEIRSRFWLRHVTLTAPEVHGFFSNLCFSVVLKETCRRKNKQSCPQCFVTCLGLVIARLQGSLCCTNTANARRGPATAVEKTPTASD